MNEKCRFRRLSSARLAPVLALALLLGGCDTVRELPSQVAALPSKVATQVGGWMSFGGDDAGGIAADTALLVLPLEGTDWPGRQALAEELARTLRAPALNVRVAARADGRAQTLSGRIEAVETGSAIVWVDIRWVHHAGDGRVITEYRQIAAMDRALWDKAAPPAVQLLASEVTPKISIALREGGTASATKEAIPSSASSSGMEVASNQPTGPAPTAAPSVPAYSPSPQGASQLPPPAPAREIAAAPIAPVQGSPLSTAWANPVILIRSVDGAPGDGNQALMLAIKQALRIRDFMVTEDPRQAVFQVEGRVEIAPPTNGRQRVKLTWIVTTVSGGQVGRAIQENTIPAGSLNGVWGQVAMMVANAAADGVEELFGRPATRKAQMAVPATPPLPLVPGRAPPPPR